jgi:cell division protein FtsW (lipid II flippase)
MTLPGRWSAVTALWLLTFLFTGLALVQLSLVRGEAVSPASLSPLLVLAACSGGTFYLARRRLTDVILLPVTFFLSGFGLVLIARLAPAFINRQLIWLAAATALLAAVRLIPKNLNWLYRYKYTWLLAGLGLLASTLVFGVNPSGYGARLWLNLGGIYFQPSELLKVLLVVFLAAYLADRRRYLITARAHLGPIPLPHPAYLGPMLLMWGFSIVLLVWQRDLGAALLFFGTFLGMLYAATGQVRYLWAGAILFVAAVIIGYAAFDVVRLRVEAFLNPWLDPAGRSFQIVQSLLAFAGGGVLGEGLGQGLPGAIPVVHTDFVFAAIGEEYGLLGAVGVLLLFALLIGRAFHLALHARTDFEQLLAAGIGTLLGLQTIVITAGTLKLMPLTGVTLPFVSYGGSSLLASFFMIGLLLFIADSPPPADPVPIDPPILHLPLARSIFTGLLIVAGGLMLWQVALAPFLVNRPDNPRPVIAEQTVRRGRLLTREGVPVAETTFAEDGVARRRYPYPNLSSVTGYYSIRYGAGGTEAEFNPVLRGAVGLTAEDKFWNGLLHRPLRGEDVTLTIDLPAQVAADVALGGQEGAVVVIDTATGAVRVMSSHPTFDPNTLDEQWDTLRTDQKAPLLNRATQGLFPVGDLARWVSLIGLVEAGAAVPPEPLTIAPETLAAPLGPTGYLATGRQLGLAQPLPGVRSLAGRLPDFPPEGRQTVKDLAVTPLHLARLLAGVEQNGQFPDPLLAATDEPTRRLALSPETARRVRGLLPQVEPGLIGLTGQASPEETGQTSLSWFVGLAPATASPEEMPPSAALVDGQMIFDPTQIPAATPAPPSASRTPQARYAIVAVVVTDAPEDQPALRIARSVVGALGRE